MSNKERLDARNEQIKRITQALARKQVSPTDMLQARVDSNNSCARLFYKYEGEDLSFIKGLDTSNVTSMMEMFYSCGNLPSLDLRTFNTSNVTTMGYMFYLCDSLTSIDLSSFDTSSVINMSYMFSNCYKLNSLDLSNFNTSNVTYMNQMFSSCDGLTGLDLSSFDTKKVTNMTQMFIGCSKLTSLDLSNWDTGNVTQISEIFRNCELVTNILGELNLIKASSQSNMFFGCEELEEVTLKNIKKSLVLGIDTSYGTKISNATLINTIQELWDLTGSTSQKLTLSTTSKENISNIYVKLVDVTDELLATDPNAGNKKPCVVCESTDEGAMTITEYLISKNWSLA